LHGQEKVPKEKAARRLALTGILAYASQGSLRVSGFWAFAQLAGRKHTRPAQTGGSLAPKSPALLGYAHGIRVGCF